MESFIDSLGEAIEDPEEEAFLLFSQTIPSNSLGFVDSKSDELVVTVGANDYAIHQSPALLRSDRETGTTGAVLWQVTPRFARWMSDSVTMLSRLGLLGRDSVVLELGAGVSGVLALSLAPLVKTYIATDQSYVLKMLRQNIIANRAAHSQSGGAKNRHARLDRKPDSGNVIVKSIDWETDDVSSIFSELEPPLVEERIDFVVACDCIYNEALVDPFVDTCAELCQLQSQSRPTLCIVAQQLRSPDVFGAWLTSFHRRFAVWRVPSHMITAELGEESGFVVHIGFVR